MELDIINHFLRITPINKDNVYALFLQQIHNMDSWQPPLTYQQKEQRIQNLEYHCSLYITRLASVHQKYPDLATNVIEGHYDLKNSFIREALYVDPSRAALTDTEHREHDIRRQSHLRVERMGYLLKVINEWNMLEDDEKEEKKDTFLEPPNEDSDYEPELDAESVLGTQDIPQQFPPEEIPQQSPPQEIPQAPRSPLQDISNKRGGFKYTSRNKKKKQKKSKKRRKKSKKRSKKSKQKRKKKKTRTK